MDDTRRDIAEQAFTGGLSRMLVAYLRAQPQTDLLDRVCELAGESRSESELVDVSGWSSYGQIRRLLEALAAICSPEAVSEVGMANVTGDDQPASATTLQDSGSLAALFRDIDIAASSLSTIVVADSEEIGGNEWLIRQHFKEGFEPYREYCEFTKGLISSSAVLFGFPPATVVHEDCQLDGATECVFRVHWEAIDEDVRRAEFFEKRARLLATQFEALQTTVTELVSTDNVEEVLAHILRSAAGAVQAPSFVLALTSEHSMSRRVYGRGLSQPDAEAIVEELIDGSPHRAHERAVVEVASARRTYGLLAAVRPDSRGFLPQEVLLLESYARLAATALDAATAVDDARRQTRTAQLLLALSRTLATTSSIGDAAAAIVRSAREIADCDEALIVLLDEQSGGPHLEGATGCLPGAVKRLRTSIAALGADRHDLQEAIESQLGAEGCAMVASAAISVDDATIGWLVVGCLPVGDARAQLDIRTWRSPDWQATIAGLAAQASIAFSNVRRLDQIRHQALYDGLTGLPNRTLILDRADQMLARARRAQAPAAALFVDIDGFKGVNDTLGHEVGDRLLKAVSARLAATLRDADTIGRLGGDEFVVLVDGNELDAGPELVAQRMIDVLREPFVLDDPDRTQLSISASIGIATGDRVSQVELLRDADLALYAAKAAGKGRFVLFQPEMHTAIKDRLELENDLRGALAAGQFFAVYQPIIDLHSMRITGVEALLRWNHPTRGVIAPNKFIGLLEDSGLICEVGAWILGQACAQTASWHDNGHRIDISVNVSSRQLEHDRFLHDLSATLERTGLDPSSVIIEITERVIMRDPDAVAERLRAIKALGVRLAIDDFGTGYSSLAHLRQFPVDCLKIDRSFIAAISETTEAGALVHTLVQLGKTLGLQTLAEGIEGTDRVDYLQSEQVDSGQGFVFAKPLDVADLRRLLDAQDPIVNVS